MKKTILTLALLVLSYIGNAQSNEFNANGNVLINNNALKLKNYLLLDSDGDFTGGNYFTIQDDPTHNILRMGYKFESDLVLGSNGYVGIGTTNPSSKLDILSNSGETESLARFKISDAPGDYLQIANTTGAANQFIPLIKGYHESDNRTTLAIMGSSSDAMDNGTHAVVNFNARRKNSKIQNRPLFSWTNYSSKMMTMAANGYLGIGTNAPSAKLDVQGIMRTSYSSSRHVSIFNSGDGNSYLNIVGGSSNSRFGFQVDGSSKMSIMKNGNIGIGTSRPDEKLTVKGTIHCEEVLVDLKVPADYVFEKYYEGASTLKATYTMPTLEEVEAFTKEHHHLPAIPSAATIKEEGLELKEMTNLLLQKIEELTLYTIEQEKRIKSLEVQLGNK